MELKQLLPSIIMLQDVSSSLQVVDKSHCVTFFQSKAAMLKPIELLINFQLNAIYFNPKLHYTADRIVGNAENNEQAASCIQCFMISSITSKK